MGRTGNSRRITAQPATHESTRRPRGDGRLDPVRWRRPGRGMLLRLAAVAALLTTAAAVLWSPPREPCGPGTATPTASPAARSRPTNTTAGTSAPAAGSTGPAVGSTGPAVGSTGPAGDGTGPAGIGEGPAGSGVGPAGGSAAPAVPEGTVGVPIRLADPTALGLVRPGNRVDLLRIDDAGGQPTPVAGSALVLQVTGVNDPTTGGLLLALTPHQANQAVATSRQGFAIVIRPG